MKLSKRDIERLKNGQLPIPKEDVVQAIIVQGLRLLGYSVMITTRRVKKCKKCGAVPHQGDGVSKGLADLLVRHPSWNRAIWMQFEVKRPGPVHFSSFEQKVAVLNDEVVVIQSLDEALDVLKAVRSL